MYTIIDMLTISEIYTIIDIFFLYILYTFVDMWFYDILDLRIIREVLKMAIKYDKLFQILKERGYSSNYWLRQNGIHSATASKLKKMNV